MKKEVRHMRDEMRMMKASFADCPLASRAFAQLDTEGDSDVEMRPATAQQDYGGGNEQQRGVADSFTPVHASTAGGQVNVQVAVTNRRMLSACTPGAEWSEGSA